MESRTLEIVANPATIFGYAGDEYFEQLPSYAAQNEVLIEELKKLPPYSTYVDVGANLGVTSIMAARLVPGLQVIAVEASPRNFRCLQRTMEENNITNCRPILCAIGERAGEIGVVEGDFAAGNYVSEVGGVKVPMMTLDALLKELGATSPDLIKVDVEGFEFEVLKGCIQTIEQGIPRFVMEFNTFALCAHSDKSPRILLDFIIDQFGQFSYHEGMRICQVISRKDVFDFMYRNMTMHQCIDDIVFGG